MLLLKSISLEVEILVKSKGSSRFTKYLEIFINSNVYFAFHDKDGDLYDASRERNTCTLCLTIYLNQTMTPFNIAIYNV